MRLTLDTEARTLEIDDGTMPRTLELYSPAAFTALSRQWLRVGWSQRYAYQFSWLGRPVVQLPEDLLRIQEVIYGHPPDVIIETGVAHGGSLVFYASLCHAVGKGRVIGVDVEIRPHNRSAIESHELARYISLVEGSSTDSAVIQAVRHLISPSDTVMVILDSNHSYAHVADELRTYAPLVTGGKYLVVQDAIMRDLSDVPGGQTSWQHDNPAEAIRDFLIEHPEFTFQPPQLVFDESAVTDRLTYWPNGWLKRNE